MPAWHHQLLQLDDIQLSLYSQGPTTGYPVWLLHGFPECWHSWRHQMQALADAGYRVLVPEMRGYGQTSAPAAAEAYDLISICGDIQSAMDTLEHQHCAVIGHDWGAPIAWHLALLEPRRVQAVAGLSVPFGGRPKRPAIDMLRQHYQDRFHYMLYFQTPGVAEAELEADLPRTLRLLMHGMDTSAGIGNGLIEERPAEGGWLSQRHDPGTPPDWCPPDAFAVYLETFRNGLRGPINWYRNFERNWQRTESLAGRAIEQPALFIIGDNDPVGELEAFTIERMPALVPQVEQHVVENCGHWIQSQCPQQVNSLLLDFLQRHIRQE